MAPKPILLFLVAFMQLMIGECRAEPFVPAHEDEIVETLPAGIQKSRRELQAALGDNSVRLPDDIETRLASARRFIELARSEGDPRYLGYAESLLRLGVTGERPSPRALVLLGTVQQARHDFSGAEATLDAALVLDSEDAQAWLTRAMVFRAQGRLDEALRSCAPLIRNADELTLTMCAASVRALDGHAAEAFGTLSAVSARWIEGPSTLRIWSLTLLAEISEQLGRDELAAQHYASALKLDGTDVYLLTAYSDFLLRKGDAHTVLTLLRDFERHDGLLLRLAMAAKIAGPDDVFTRYRNELQARIDAAHLRGDSIHLREEAMMELDIRGDARRAVELAKKNFEVQRELPDVQILLRSAIVAGDTEAAETARRFLALNRTQDVRLQNI